MLSVTQSKANNKIYILELGLTLIMTWWGPCCSLSGDFSQAIHQRASSHALRIEATSLHVTLDACKAGSGFSSSVS